MNREPDQPAIHRPARGSIDRPTIGIAPDLCEHLGRETVRVATTYADAIRRAGGCPVILAPPPDASLDRAIGDALGLCDALVLTGGDDPKTEPFGVPTHPSANPVRAQRQSFESALLRAFGSADSDRPVLGVCLGMQMMALITGGSLEQYMPDVLDTHAQHWDREHELVPTTSDPLLRAGTVASKHRQAVQDPGEFEVIAEAPDGTIEAIRHPGRRFALGVQWHPERTQDPALGDDLFRRLVDAARAT